ncbi:MAG TPA: uroporphyrinogen-III synthase [Propionibacteriaceae bacterium]
MDLRAGDAAAGGQARVVFVGAGPGDPELLTVAAISAIQSADIVVTDSKALIELVTSPPVEGLHARLVTSLEDLGVGPVGTPEQRAAAALSHARDGETVARVVVGDPFLDADAAPEAAAIVRLGCTFEVVPGVSLLTVVPEYAGVNLASGGVVQFLPGAVRERKDSSPRIPEGDLVIALRASMIGDLVTRALGAGRKRDEPALVTLSGASISQRSVHTTVGQLVASVSGVAPEALVHVIVGQLAAQDRSDLDWFESKPLFGWRVLVPRTKDGGTPMTTRLRSYGAASQEVATISIERPRTPHQMDRAIRGLVDGEFEWVAFTSPNAVRAVREKIEEYGLDARAFSGLKVAAVGGATADSLSAMGIEPDLVATEDPSAAGLGELFPEYDAALDPINRVFVPRADVATEALTSELVNRGWEIEDVTAFRTVRAAPPPAVIREGIKAGAYDAVLFSSSSSVRNFVGIAGKPHSATIVAAIGPATAKECEAHGLRVDVLANAPTGADLADALAVFAYRRRESMVAAGQRVTRPSQRSRRRRTT